ncbi:TlpA family protein disulfide reductase [Sphingobacterium sp. HJSM2_6]|uniref:TlpA family protein disulfide reductase n=1 Tax=Sphingobacterium sp. HJSM2_6 TaxID=3366264 RepID=UPI003BD07BBF
MKKLVSLITLLCISLASLAQPSNITGTTTLKQVKKLSLYKTLNGRLIEVATANTDQNGRFAFRFTPEYEGFYCIGYGPAHYTTTTYKFYFKGNEDLEIKLNADNYELIKTNSNAIKTLFKWDQALNEIANKSMTLAGSTTYVDFFPLIESFQSTLASFKKNPKTGNKIFDAWFPTIVDNDFAYCAINFMYMPHPAHPSKDEYSSYYENFNTENYFKEDLLKLPYGDRFISNLVLKKASGKKNITKETLIESIPLDVLKGQYILNFIERSTNIVDFNKLTNDYGKYLTLPEQKQRVEAMEIKLAETKAGVPAVNFTFSDIDAKPIKLTDFKGKLVLIDMWATWCGPCRAEEPFWEKLNDTYKGKEIAFVGVSTDQDKEKWEAYIKEKALKGTQLHAGPTNPLSQAYKINTIPRYLLIDKKGNLITPDCPRPSDPKLIELIDTWLTN